MSRRSACTGIRTIGASLLGLLAEPDPPTLDQILVVTPDLEATAPLIDAVFGTVPRERFIPYTITGRARSRANGIARALLQLLALLGSRCGVSEVFDLARNADLKLVVIGTVDNQAHLVTSGMLQANELEEIRDLGGVGELLGHFFDSKGRILETSVTARTLAASFSETGDDRLVAIAGGPVKTEAIRAVLHSHKLHGLITDEATARLLLQSSA